jgi:hypothetical protein
METKPNGRGAEDETHQRFVLSDPVAFSYLEEDPSTKVIARNQILKGYECYLVEQWACSRVDPTFIIHNFTGDPSHSIIASVLSVPIDESAWSQRLKLYFDTLQRYHARRKETGFGIILVANLGTFPSSLTVIPVPNGDVRGHREDFFVNENLKRLGCSGRVGLTLSKPSPATAAKFYQLYRASQKIPLNAAVIELVKLCQIALMIFGKLELEYTDGLLCDETEKSINDWWIEFGTEYYSFEPHDGVLGPTTVAALLGTLIGARNRLHAAGAPIAKDVFDVEATKRAIAYFQKTHKMPKTRRLDRQTLARLHRSTSKVASGDGWFVPRTVKSTLSEFTGKGGEMVTHMIGSKDKTIAEVESVDIERFVQNVYGARAKWLWQGKSRKMEEPVTIGTYGSTDNIHARQLQQTERFQEASDERERSRLKKLSDRQQPVKSNDSNRALGKIKGAVGLRHHQNHHRSKSRDGLRERDASLERVITDPHSLSLTQQSSVTDQDNFFSPKFNTNTVSDARYANQLLETPLEMHEKLQYHENVEPPSDLDDIDDLELDPDNQNFPGSFDISAEPSIAGSVYRGVDLDDLFEENGDSPIFGPGFRRTQSFAASPRQNRPAVASKRARFPRNLSFGVIEEGLSTWAKILETFQPRDNDDSVLASSDLERALRVRRALQELDSGLVDWVQEEIQKADRLALALAKDGDELTIAIETREEEFREMALESKEIVTTEREQLEEVVKEIELLSSKLDYETKMLKGKVEDVEGGVGEFERQVIMVEERVAQLEMSMEPKESWSHWLLRILTGIGQAGAG